LVIAVALAGLSLGVVGAVVAGWQWHDGAGGNGSAALSDAGIGPEGEKTFERYTFTCG
jgi:hypothetical protein